MPRMHGELHIDYATFRRMELNEPRPLLRLIAGRLFALFLAGSGVWWALNGAFTMASVYAVLFGAGIIGLQEGLLALTWRLQRRRYAGPIRYEVTNEGAAVHTATGTERVEWANVARVHRGRHAWSVKQDFGALAFVIPRAAFSPEDSRAINDFFLAHPEFAG
jgi:hypothetical protein